MLDYTSIRELIINSDNNGIRLAGVSIIVDHVVEDDDEIEFVGINDESVIVRKDSYNESELTFDCGTTSVEVVAVVVATENA